MAVWDLDFLVIFLVTVFSLSLRLPPSATFHLSEAIALAEARLEHRDPGTRQATSRRSQTLQTAGGMLQCFEHIAELLGQAEPGCSLGPRFQFKLRAAPPSR